MKITLKLINKDMNKVINFKQTIEKNKNSVRCGFCFNELAHSINLNVIEIHDLQLDDGNPCFAILCDDCDKAKRKPKNVVLFLGEDDSLPKNTIYYVDINDRIILEPKKKQEKPIKPPEQAKPDGGLNNKK